MKIHKTKADAKAAIRLEVLQATGRKRIAIAYREVDGDCHCGHTCALQGIGYNPSGSYAHMTRVHSICKNCG